MGRSYAALLGCLAFATTIARGLVHGGGLQTTVDTAIGWLVAFAVVGWIVGELAAWIVDDSIRSEMKPDGAGMTPAEAGN
jgi:hypothetical protein